MTDYKSRVLQLIRVLSVLCVAMLMVSCGSTVVRENIISSIETGIGLTISENKQTQLYEVKAGYIRSQFYSLPTGKVVKSDQTAFTNESTCRKIGNIPIGILTAHDERVKVFSLLSSCVSGKNTQISNAANITPELISGIHSDMGVQDILFGMKVSESFAVGKEAVKSNAAVAMYVANAKTDESAKQASAAMLNITSKAAATESVPIIDKLLDEIKVLSKEHAILLANNPPVTNADTEKHIDTKVDSKQNRKDNEAVAKEVIKQRIFKAQPDTAALKKWEKAIDAYTTAKEKN